MFQRDKEVPDALGGMFRDSSDQQSAGTKVLAHGSPGQHRGRYNLGKYKPELVCTALQRRHAASQLFELNIAPFDRGLIDDEAYITAGEGRHDKLFYRQSPCRLTGEVRSPLRRRTARRGKRAQLDQSRLVLGHIKHGLL